MDIIKISAVNKFTSSDKSGKCKEIKDNHDKDIKLLKEIHYNV